MNQQVHLIKKQEKIIELLFNDLQHKTIFVITHDANILTKFDKTIELKNEIFASNDLSFSVVKRSDLRCDDPKSYFCLVINENSYGSSELCQFEFISEIFNVNLIKINNTHWIEDYSEIKALIGSNYDCLILGLSNHWSAFLAAFYQLAR